MNDEVLKYIAAAAPLVAAGGDTGIQVVADSFARHVNLMCKLNYDHNSDGFGVLYKACYNALWDAGCGKVPSVKASVVDEAADMASKLYGQMEVTVMLMDKLPWPGVNADELQDLRCARRHLVEAQAALADFMGKRERMLKGE